MQKLQHSLCLWAVALFTLLGTGAGMVRADHPLAGKWKVTILSSGAEVTVWLIEIEEKNGKFTGKVVGAGPKNFDQVKIDKVEVKDKSLHVSMFLHSFPLYLSAYAPKDAQEPKTLLGSLILPDGGEPARLDRTEAVKIDPKEVEKTSTGHEELKKFKEAELLSDKVGVLEFIVKKYPDAPVTLHAAINLIHFTSEKASEAELKKLSETTMKNAAKYGPELEMVMARTLVPVLLKSEKGKDLALEHARKAIKSISPGVPPSDQETTLRMAAHVLKQAGKEDEAKKAKQQLDKLGPLLDEQFKKTAIPFTVDEYKGRKGTSKRVVVVELFTGAQCPPCVAADAAFDGLLKTYKPSEVVLLQYHLHIPGPDPLTSPGSEKRAEYYNIEYTPDILINGKKGPAVGGGKQHAKIRYDDLREILDEKLEEKVQGEVSLKVSRRDDTIDVAADAAKLKAGTKLRLRLAVVEDMVHYPGGNKQRFHHQVVRGFVGGADGIAITKPGTYKESLDLKKLKLDLINYLEEQHKAQPFLDDARPLELQNLKIVAFIQSDDSREILNAVQVDVPEK